MSDSEGKKELAGIARAIDALFSPPPPTADDESGLETPPDPPNVSGDALTGAPDPLTEPTAEEPASAVRADEPAPVDLEAAAPPPLPDAAGAEGGPPPLPEDAEFFGGATPDDDPPPLPPSTDVSDAPPPLPEGADPSDAPPSLLEGADSSDEPPPLPAGSDASDGPPPLPREVDGADTPPPLPEPGDDPDVLPPAPGTAELEPAPAPDAADVSTASAVGGEDDDEPPTPLDEAVADYLAGDRAREADIRRLADEMLEDRAVDPVARAVGRLAATAGDPPDEDVLDLARDIASPVVLGRLAVHLGGERDEARRQEYFVACRNLGEPMGRAIRDDLAQSTDRLARRVYCEALVEMGPVGRTIVEEMVDDENRFLVRNAVTILGDTGGDGAVELVTRALANPDARVRREALRSLAKLGDEESGDLVLGLLEDSDRAVRIQAAVTAGELHVDRAVRHVIRMLDETKDPDEVIPLVRALGHLGDPGAVPSIEKHAVRTLFSKPRTDVRIVAYRALSQIGTPHARRLLNQAMDDKDAEVKAAVKEMLGVR